jgi:hypothetical protein
MRHLDIQIDDTNEIPSRQEHENSCYATVVEGRISTELCDNSARLI